MSSQAITRIPRSLPLREEAYRYLKELILTTQLAPGSPIIEEQLAEQLGISRTPLREVLARLENEGLIQRNPTRGTSVASFDVKNIHQLFQVREALERVAARQAAIKIPTGELDSIKGQFDAAQQEVEAGNYKRYYESHHRLHDLILQSADNPLLVQFMTMLDDRIRLVRAIAGEQPERHVKQGYAEQTRLLDALLARDPGAAEEAMAAHLQNASERISRQLMENRRELTTTNPSN